MDATKLLQEIKDFNSLRGGFFTIEHETHDINIWFSRVLDKWVLEFNGKAIESSKNLTLVVNKLVDLNLI